MKERRARKTPLSDKGGKAVRKMVTTRGERETKKLC